MELGRIVTRSPQLRLAISRIVGLTILIALAALGTPASDLTAQEPESSLQRLRVFLDCQTGGCDFDYVRREIAFVDWVRDRRDGDVHALVTSVAAGGGTRYDLRFIGVDAFSGEESQSSVTVSQTDTDVEQRAELTRALRIGLVPFASRTEAGARLDVFVPGESSEEGGVEPLRPQDDPWDHWVVTVSGSGQYAEESTTTGGTFEGAVDINRTTERLKIRLAAGSYYREDRFDFDGEPFTSIARAGEATAFLAIAADDHFSLGAKSDVWMSTFTNTDLAGRWALAAEVNAFPYAESSRREFTFLYTAGYNRVRYAEETIYDKTFETIWDHSLLVDLVLKQPWGSADLSMVGRQHLTDLDRYRLTAEVNLQVRIFRGLSLGVSTGYEAIRDQVFLAKRGATEEEVLLQRKTLATEYRFYTEVGLSFTFGSIFNNVVNPRLNSLRNYRM